MASKGLAARLAKVQRQLDQAEGVVLVFQDFARPTTQPSTPAPAPRPTLTPPVLPAGEPEPELRCPSCGAKLRNHHGVAGESG
jgi:hypothetical protein